MRITISGTPGSGKTVVSKYLAKNLNFDYYSVGDLIRDFANRNNLDLISLGKLMKSNERLDKEFNEIIKKLNKKNNFVLDSRLGFFFIKNSVNIFLDADLNLRAKRIFKDARKLENYNTIKKVRWEIDKRFSLERERFRKLYKLDFSDSKHYDLIIDTTDMNVKIISDIILRYLKRTYDI